jgi:HAD superfamily hydrolase (TIGR01457 family)
VVNKLVAAKCFLFDMDGTIYLGNRLLPGVVEFTHYLEERQIPYYFLTNNSSRSRADYVTKLAGLGLAVPLEKVISSGEATAIYLEKQKPGAKLYLVGTPSLASEFLDYGFELVDSGPEIVVLGFDTTLTYEKIRRLCDFVRAGLPYIATHPDINCPTEDGYMPDIGAVIALVSASTGREPDVIVGKPHRPIVEAVIEKTGFAAEEIVMVGDRLYTDIALGQSGLTTVLVLSGETNRKDLVGGLYQPDFIAQDLDDLYSQVLDAQA